MTEECNCLATLDKLRLWHEERKVNHLTLAASVELEGKPVLLTCSHRPSNEFLLVAIHQIIDMHLEDEDR